MSDPWTSPGIIDRYRKWLNHQENRSILEGPDWNTKLLVLKPRDVLSWNITLLWSAANADPEIVEIALQNGANPKRSVSYFKRVKKGKMLKFCGAYYYWGELTNPRTLERMEIKTPIQAAVAGGNPECFQLIATASKIDRTELDNLNAWLMGVEFDTYSRVEGGLIIAEYILRLHKTTNDELYWSEWVQFAQMWMRSKYGAGELKHPELVETWRRLNRFCSEFGMKSEVPNPILAQLL